ncbi:MAG: hypothetical protein EA398_17490 [Deltaproteobacteria bacterium]|nr:MAG: hypothetical protein EA398_17490 [Deltaproteobacteria bacterium]
MNRFAGERMKGRSMIRTGRWTIAMALGAALAIGGLSACGGGSPPPAEVAPAPEPVRQTPPPSAPAEVDTRMWHVFWDGIHIATVYPEGGQLRSRRPAEQARPPWGERSPAFSVISLYSQTEDRLAALIRQAADADELVGLIEALGDMEVVEERNPAYPE